MGRDRVNDAITWIRRVGCESQAFDVTQLEQVPQHRSHGVVTIRPDGDLPPVRLRVETRSRLTPREAIALATVLGRTSEEAITVVCCPFISPRVAEILTHAGVGYVDQGGNARIAGRGFFLHVTGQDNPSPDTRPLSNPFASRSSRIVRLMLEEPMRMWQVQELAREADVSIGLASKAKQALMEEGYLRPPEGGLRLSDPVSLLESWCRRYTNRDETASCYVMSDQREMVRRLAEWCDRTEVNWALSDFSGAWRLSPMVRHTQTSFTLSSMVLDQRRCELLEHLHARVVDSGANLSLRFTDDPYTFYKSRIVDQVKVLSPLQLYLDLKIKHGRGEEAAAAIYDQHLRECFTACLDDNADRRAARDR